MTVLNTVFVIATLGFQNSLPREAAFYKEREPSRVGDLISTALVIVAVDSLIWTVILFLEAGNISQVFKDARLVNALRIVVFALPFLGVNHRDNLDSKGFSRLPICFLSM